MAVNLLRGTTTDDLVQGLIDAGVSESLATATVTAVSTSAGLGVAREHQRRSRRRGLVARLCGEIESTPLVVERGPAPGAAEFFARYWEASRPAIFTDVVPRWHAKWTPQLLRERYGDVPIEACQGREGDPRPDANWQKYRVTMTLAEYVDRMAEVDEGNDLYLIANNRNTARPQMRSLWDDVVLPDGWFAKSRLATGSALWLGPGGTVTPLHHDTSNILLCQIHGRKRIVLAPPWDLNLLETADGVYNQRTVEQAEQAGAQTIAMTLEAGEALFIPVGWWHDVRAVDPSVSLAINAFARANVFEWYRPGSVR